MAGKRGCLPTSSGFPSCGAPALQAVGGLSRSYYGRSLPFGYHFSISTFLDHHLFDVARNNLNEKEGESTDKRFFFSFFLVKWCFPFETGKTDCFRECVASATIPGIPFRDRNGWFPVGILPRCYHLRNIRVDGGGGGGEIGGGVVSSQDAMGGWDHERWRDWWFLSGGRLRCLKFLLYQTFSQICSGCEMH